MSLFNIGVYNLKSGILIIDSISCLLATSAIAESLDKKSQYEVTVLKTTAIAQASIPKGLSKEVATLPTELTL